MSTGKGCLVIILATIMMWFIMMWFMGTCMIDSDKKQKDVATKHIVTELNQDREKKLHQQEIFQDKLNQFASTKVPELQKAIDELAILDKELESKISQLGDILKQAGKEPDQDEDYIEWKLQHSKVKKHSETLRQTLTDTYITYKKFELSPKSADKTKLNEALQKGRNSALDVSTRYKSLKESL